MRATILNREFKHPADGWYQIEAKGTHPNRAAGVVQVIDDAAAASIVNRFNADAAAGTLRHGAEMLIDHEHFSDQPDQETRAYGWLTQLQNRADGIYGQIRWTKTGQEAVDGGDYRFFSTEYVNADLVELGNQEIKNQGKSRSVRPMRLDGLTLTNMNNNRGQKPITNREPNSPGIPPGAVVNQKQTQRMKDIAKTLGLSEDAAPEAVSAEITKLQNRASELETLNLTLLGEQVDSLMDAHGIKTDDTTRRGKLRPVLMTMKNREDRLGFLADCVKIEAPAAKPQTKLFNRDTRPPQAGKADGPDAKSEQAFATKVQNRASELQKQIPNLSAASAFRMAQNELENGS